MITNPTPCRFVLYHFAVHNDDHKIEFRSRPAVVTSVGASDDIVNLFVFFEPGDSDDVYRPLASHQFAVSPLDPLNPQPHRWSWPPRTPS